MFFNTELKEKIARLTEENVQLSSKYNEAMSLLHQRQDDLVEAKRQINDLTERVEKSEALLHEALDSYKKCLDEVGEVTEELNAQKELLRRKEEELAEAQELPDYDTIVDFVVQAVDKYTDGAIKSTVTQSIGENVAQNVLDFIESGN